MSFRGEMTVEVYDEEDYEMEDLSAEEVDAIENAVRTVLMDQYPDRFNLEGMRLTPQGSQNVMTEIMSTSGDEVELPERQIQVGNAKLTLVFGPIIFEQEGGKRKKKRKTRRRKAAKKSRRAKKHRATRRRV